ncbi:MAG: S24 family peptidase [Pseudomonadota bacterium]
MQDNAAKRRDELGISNAEITRRAGFKRTWVYDFFDDDDPKPKIDNLERLAEALETSVGWLTGVADQPSATPKRDIPVMGSVAGSTAGAIRMESEPVDWLPRPIALAGARDLYGGYIAGDSMLERFRHGEPVIAHPHRPVRKGDHVIVQQQTKPDGDIEGFIKEFVKFTEKTVVVRQYNPPAEITFERRHVVGVHRVLTNAELLGLA